MILPMLVRMIPNIGCIQNYLTVCLYTPDQTPKNFLFFLRFLFNTLELSVSLSTDAILDIRNTLQKFVDVNSFIQVHEISPHQL